MTVSQNLSKEMAFEWRSYNEKKPDVQKGSKKTLEIEDNTNTLKFKTVCVIQRRN